MHIFKVKTRTGSSVCGLAVMAALILASPPASAQEETTVTATVLSSSRNTLTVRTEAGRVQLFVLERDTRLPATLAAGSEVRVTSSPGDDPAIRVASEVTLVRAVSRATPFRPDG